MLPHTDILAEFCLLAALGVLAAALVAMRADAKLTQRRQAEQESTRRQWSRTLGDAAFDGLLIHRQGVILQMNRALCRMLNIRERECIGQHFATFARPDQTNALRAELEAPHPQIAEFCLLRPNKSELYVELSSQNIDFEGAPATVTALRDISQRLADAKTISRLTHYDALTGLPNRKSFQDRLAGALAAHDRSAGTLTILLLDLYQFKTVNTQLGRAGGDALLKQVATRITGVAAREDLLARLGGDKFALLIACPAHAQRAASLGGQLQAAFAEPFIIEGQLMKLSVSIGIAAYPDHAADAESLMKASAFALAQAERAGGGGVHVFSHHEANVHNKGPQEAHRLASDLRQALTRGEIRLTYQPYFRAVDLAPAGFEALPRWHHATEGVIGPERFLPLAEAAGMSHDLGSYILERACAEAVAAAAPRLSVSLAAISMRDINLAARIAATLRKTGLAPAALEIEISETLLVEQRAGVAQTLASLAAIGVSTALDDFGAGHSSLESLCGLPFSRLKIDRRFVTRLGTDPAAEAIVNALLNLAASLRLEVTAMGVERPEQLDYLRRQGCHLLQGPLLAPASPQALAPQPIPRPALVIARG